MVFRKPNLLADFEIFKKLYEDEEGIYQFLYICSKKEDRISCTSETDCSYFFDESISELFSNYTLERFQKDLESSSLLYMIEDSFEIIGYISMFYCSAGKYKIAEWAMLDPDDEDKKTEVLNCLKKLKLPLLKKFSICTLNDEVVHFLISNGFYSSDASSFYNLDII